ncbi:MAG TPA: adenylate/guanylate cyclase domain-containing protein, partial [Desulfosarcina sp.]|nr:adenylate/guanylate cyclase domain-containing protein [Desulfosarcina sp.]
VQTITRCRKVFYQCIDRHGGRVVNAPGDSILAEFPSVVDAVSCAMVIQEELAGANADLPHERQMVFRIGVNLGDVIQKGPDIYGDGVNIAARVEAFAEGGGVCITRSVFDQVKNQLPRLNFHYLGEHTVKNIVEPVRVYHVATKVADHPDSIEASRPTHSTLPTGAVSIAVLPFESLSGSRDHDYFSVGFVDDLNTDLAHFANLQVISTYTTQKMSADGRGAVVVAGMLGIDYLLKGNLRRFKGQVRISAQLMETRSGRISWAERYDAPVDTLFDIQDDIVARVVSAISAQIDRALLTAARKKPVTSMAAYDFWLRGMERLRQGTPAADQDARKMFNQALAVDPHYSRAYAGLSLSYFNDWSCQLWEQWETTERNAYDYAMRAFTLDDTDHVVQMILGRILLFRRQFDQAEQHLDKALMLNANDADSLVQIAACMAYLGKAERGEQLFRKGMRLNPYRDNWYYTYGSLAYFVQRRYDAFIDTASKAPLTEVWIDLPAYLAAAYAHTGDGRRAALFLKRFQDAFSQEILKGKNARADDVAGWLRKANPFRNEADTSNLIDGLVLAGLDTAARPETRKPSGPLRHHPTGSANEFRKVDRLWRMAFEGKTVQLPPVKGFLDLAVLLAQPGSETHCTQLMGSVVQLDERELVIDDQARRDYEGRIRDLQEAVADAETMNDLHRRQSLEEELDRLTAHLAQALGLGGRTRSVNAPAARARSAVTWRIRSAIRKIQAVHPALGKHLSHAIHTGTFCSYAPEKEQVWRT